MSGDGRYIVFHEPQLPDSGDPRWPAFVFDRQTGQSAKVADSSAPGPGLATVNRWGPGSAAISADGRCIAFSSSPSSQTDVSENLGTARAYITSNPLFGK